MKVGAAAYLVDLREVTSTVKSEDIEKLCKAVPPELVELIRKYPRIFPDDLPAGLPPSRPEDHRIELEPGAQPTVQRQFWLSQPELEEMQQRLDYLLTKDFIWPSTSPYTTPILFMPKKDGGFRMCIDYRALNRITIKSRYPIPRADELLDQLRGAKFFSKIDLRGGYHQIRVAAGDYHKTEFRTRCGSYEYLVMPFGLTNAPSTFQMTMNGVFRKLLDKCVIMYLDDILIYSRNREQHLRDLDVVFTLLHKNRLITKGSKCDFLKQVLEFLGHIVSTEGVKIDPKKIKTIKEWKPPSNIKELQIFLGFVNYVRRFIPNMAGLSAPLTDRVKDHDCFWWREKQQAAFDQLKIGLTSPPILCIADPDRPYEVITDASDIAISAVLLQDFGEGLQPVAYESRKLQGAEKNYTVHDKEVLVIVHTFKTWRCYLTGVAVTVRTNHKSHKYLRAQPNLNPRQIRWLDFLQSNFHYTITYKWGTNNIADALTRPTAHRAAILIAQTSPLRKGLFIHGYKIDPFQQGGLLSCSAPITELQACGFGKIDLRGGYHQIRVAAEDCNKTAFRTRYGSYEYLVMPFGLTNAPSTFQITMNGIFWELLDKCVSIYLDDILIYSRSQEQHLRDLDAVSTLLHKNRLITKGSKCYNLKQKLEFLGHVVSTEGVKIDPKKIKTIQEWKPPTNLKELQSFLGFVNYVRRFIPNMAGLPSEGSRMFLRAAGLLQPLDPPELPWQHVTMDYVTGLPAGPSGNDAILVVVDRLTKMAHFIACQQTITAEQTAQLFLANVIRLHGLPPAIISDRDPKFTSNFWRHLWDQFGTKLQFSSAYHPQTDGQTERVNQTMEQLLRTTCTDPSIWEKSLPLLEFAYNNASSATTHQSPFFPQLRTGPRDTLYPEH
ncbi:hypothetical protein CLOP_g7049 [Closterium sp. NIES-67]|nr:hypothetical protein CLOP_g7049 [Closterium sp. NIES-67]